jgi:TolB-like protein/tetratricopeptide (TPR) repeat protein
MGEESPKPASTSTGAVFLSYASQDAEAAQRICAALRSAGVEVWFDQSELRGGDAWDQLIRKQIKTCALFLSLISKHTHERAEGYFRLEWKLAVDRSQLIMANKAFLMPVVIDETADDDENVPEKFREVQWTHLPAGETPPEFVTRIQQLLSGESPMGARRPAAVASGKFSRLKPAWLGIIVALAIAAAYVLVQKPWVTKPAPPLAFAPPPHSIAVLPFVNMSGDKEQEYLSDGLTEELLNSLAEINELQVAARTSSFSFKGEKVDVETIAHKLNVGAVLEGSVRRSGNTVRVTAQLINAVTGFHLWSHTYDRDLGDVLKLETEIATAVASALKVSLLGDVATKIELGGTRNPAAFDAYLHGVKASASFHDAKDLQAAIDAFTEAIHLDPNYALALARRSRAMDSYAGLLNSTPETRNRQYDQARDDALQSIALAPDLAEGHLALASFLESGALDFTRANDEYERARALAPGNASVLRLYGYFAVRMGHTDAGLTALRRAVVLDPLERASHRLLADALIDARQYDAALAVTQDALAIDPHDPYTLGLRGTAYYLLGRFESARESCVNQPDYWLVQQCLVLAYDKLGRRADAEAALSKLKASEGDSAAYQYAEIFAQRGDRDQALTWLEAALRLRDPGLYSIKTDPLLDPLRNEPRFRAVIRELNLPD